MKKTLIAIILSMTIFSANFAQAQVEEKKVEEATFIMDEEGNMVETTDPVMEFEEEKHDFGTVGEGPKIKHEFKFTNIGKEPLIISKVKASCGCTTPLWPKEPIMPGEEAVISAVYNTKNRPGPFNKAITITSNSHTPTKRLFIKGKVDKAVVENIEETVPVKKESIVNEKKED